MYLCGLSTCVNACHANSIQFAKGLALGFWQIETLGELGPSMGAYA